jgi:hypothetical protein
VGNEKRPKYVDNDARLREHRGAEYDVDFHMPAMGRKPSPRMRNEHHLARPVMRPVSDLGETMDSLVSRTLTPQTHGRRDGPNHAA